jgi:hypothetical protein
MNEKINEVLLFIVLLTNMLFLIQTKNLLKNDGSWDFDDDNSYS